MCVYVNHTSLTISSSVSCLLFVVFFLSMDDGVLILQCLKAPTSLTLILKNGTRRESGI